jgi:isopentenyl diphosphate isomerase/L-lactate dehydrogenase-like FMN-dependent dehydrogenase
MTDDEVRSPAPGRARQSEIFRAGASGRRPSVPTSWASLVGAAERAMSPDAWAYVAGSAGRESTAEANYEAFDAWRLIPRMLRDVSERDLSIELFGRRHPTPLLASPIGVLELVDPDADLAIARAAGCLGITSIVSSQASQPMEHIAATGAGPWWFQLYWSSEDALVESFVARAEASGAEAIVVTLDTGMLGWRPRDLDRGFLPFIHGMGIAQ